MDGGEGGPSWLWGQDNPSLSRYSERLESLQLLCWLLHFWLANGYLQGTQDAEKAGSEILELQLNNQKPLARSPHLSEPGFPVECV